MGALLSEGDRIAFSRYEAAKVLGVSVRLIDEYLADGRFSPVRMGRRVLIPRAQIEAIVEGAVQSRGKAVSRGK